MELHSDKDNKLIIPDNVEKVIRNLCALSPNREWSGILFYSFEGDFNNGLTLTCQDILVLNQGSGTFTEFDASNPEVARYMFEHQLFNCCIGLCHSHNTFRAFFSGTDTNTLLQEGKDCNNFLSLIVNNAGQYEAAITRKVTTNSEVYKKTTSNGEYTLFNTGDTVILPEKVTESSHRESSITVEYFPLRIEKNDNITANPECEAFSKVIAQRTETKYPKYEPASEYTKAATWKPSNSYTPAGDYYDSLFKEYGVSRKPAETENTNLREYDTSVKETETETLEAQCKLIDWNKKEYLLFMERLFFGSPFIATPKCEDFKSEIQYIARNFNAACSKAFEDTTVMAEWFISSLDYYTYFTDFSIDKKLSEYEEYFDDYAVVLYRIAQAFKELPQKYDYIIAATNILESKI